MNITMYCREGCPDCMRAKRFLEENSVSYTELDIEQSPDAKERVMQANDGKAVTPTFEIDGKFYSNPDNNKLTEILEI